MVGGLAALDYGARDGLVAAVASTVVTGDTGLRQPFSAISRTHVACVNIALALASLGWAPSAAVRHLQWAPLGRTRLEAALAGLTDEMLDATPSAGEWSIRRQLSHVERTYKRYSIATLWAVRRGDDEPLLPPPNDYPARVDEPEGTESEPLSAAVSRLRRAWADAIAPLVDIPEEKLRRPTEWHAAEHTVGFRLHRFGAHDLEMATDVRRTAAALGVELTLPRLLAVDLAQSWGEIESALLGVPESLLDVQPESGAPLRFQLESLAAADRETAAALAD